MSTVALYYGNFVALLVEFHSGFKIPLAAVKGMWQKATTLLSDPDAISAAP